MHTKTPYKAVCSLLRNTKISFNTGVNKYRNFLLTTGAPVHKITHAIYIFVSPYPSTENADELLVFAE